MLVSIPFSLQSKQHHHDHENKNSFHYHFQLGMRCRLNATKHIISMLPIYIDNVGKTLDVLVKLKFIVTFIEIKRFPKKCAKPKKIT